MIENELFEQLEPTSDQRGAARSLYGFFIALIDEGFDEVQAIQLVGKIAANVISNDDDD